MKPDKVLFAEISKAFTEHGYPSTVSGQPMSTQL